MKAMGLAKKKPSDEPGPPSIKKRAVEKNPAQDVVIRWIILHHAKVAAWVARPRQTVLRKNAQHLPRKQPPPESATLKRQNMVENNGERLIT